MPASGRGLKAREIFARETSRFLLRVKPNDVFVTKAENSLYRAHGRNSIHQRDADAIRCFRFSTQIKFQTLPGALLDRKHFVILLSAVFFWSFFLAASQAQIDDATRKLSHDI